MQGVFGTALHLAFATCHGILNCEVKCLSQWKTIELYSYSVYRPMWMGLLLSYRYYCIEFTQKNILNKNMGELMFS